MLPVESGAREKNAAVRLSPNDYISVEAAIAAALPGDTILLDPGHHWESRLHINKTLRFIGDAAEPSRVVIELTDAITVNGNAKLMMCGITVRRPRKTMDKGPAIISTDSTVTVCTLVCVVHDDATYS